MTSTTQKLSGPALQRFLRRLYAGQKGIDDETAARLAAMSSRVLTSARIRRSAWAELQWDRRGRAAAVPDPAAPAAEAEAGAFDPYTFGLVPVYQREGAEGLANRLSGITDVAHLRQMARAQQIALDARLRGGEVDVGELRSAIVEAVARRIADRKAAAG